MLGWKIFPNYNPKRIALFMKGILTPTNDFQKSYLCWLNVYPGPLFRVSLVVLLYTYTTIVYCNIAEYFRLYSCNVVLDNCTYGCK